MSERHISSLLISPDVWDTPTPFVTTKKYEEVNCQKN